MNQPPFIALTCEAKHQKGRRIPFAFDPNAHDMQFAMDDPFGLRKAILPIFRRDPQGKLYGQGTAMHVDGAGTFLTADHVTEFVHRNHRLIPGQTVDIDAGGESVVVLMLGLGLVYGLPEVPQKAFA